MALIKAKTEDSTRSFFFICIQVCNHGLDILPPNQTAADNSSSPELEFQLAGAGLVKSNLISRIQCEKKRRNVGKSQK